jgi:prepilin-type N-terminal cleavage/methylation domain-containing protein
MNMGISKLRAGKASARGFTLVELMIVVALMAIIGGISVPSISKWRNNLTYRQTALRMSSMLREGRSMAITKNSTSVVVFKPLSSCFVLMSSAVLTVPKQRVRTPQPVVLKSGQSGAPTANVKVQFFPNGTALLDTTTANGGGVALVYDTLNNRKYSVTTTITGRITVQRY